MKMRKLLALLTAVLLMMQLPLSALAATYYLTDGSVYITTSSGRGQVVKQGSSEWEDLAPVISSNGVETGNTIEVTTNDGVNANVTLEDVNIKKTGSAMTVNAGAGTKVTVELDGENSLDGSIGLEKAGDGNLTITDTNNDGELIASGGSYSASIGSGMGKDVTNITIEGGKITADGSYGAAIGAGQNGDASNIIINGGTIDANSNYGAAIGAGQSGNAANIQINGGTVTADGGYAAAIGAGQSGTANGIIITDGAVDAKSSFGAAIGGGQKGDGTNIAISGGSVTAKTTAGGAAIGGGQYADGTHIEISGGNVTATTTNGGAGIGGGQGGYNWNQGNAEYVAGGDGVDIAISGGTVTANASNGAAGIGGGGSNHKDANGGNASDITISGNATVAATSTPSKNGHTGEAIGAGGGKINGTSTPVDTSGLYNTGNVTMGEGDNAETIVGTVPDPNAPVAAAPVYYGEYCYGGPGTWSATSHEVDEPFWQDVVAQLRAAEKGKAVLINVGDRKVMPAYVMEAVRETGITLIIQWDGGDDIIIEKAYPYKDAYQVYWLQNLNRILASVK